MSFFVFSKKIFIFILTSILLYSQNITENSLPLRAKNFININFPGDKIESVNNIYYGEIINGNFIKNINYTEKQDEIKFENMPVFKSTSPVLKITPYVGMAYPQLNKNIKAVLTESYHSGTVNTASKDLEKFCNTAKQFNIPVFLTGSETGFFYESKELYSKLGIQVLPTVTPISAYIKLWILCENNAKDIYKAFSKSIGGDIL